MIDTDTLFSELARIFKCSPNDFFCRLSMAKYIENSFKNEGLPWTWMCKIGIKNNAFDARINNMGVKEHAELLSPKFSKRLSENYHLNNNQVGKQIYQLLNSYYEYLSNKMSPRVKRINKDNF